MRSDMAARLHKTGNGAANVGTETLKQAVSGMMRRRTETATGGTVNMQRHNWAINDGQPTTNDEQSPQ